MARSSYAGADAGARRMQQFLSAFFQAQWNSFLSMVLPLFCKNPLLLSASVTGNIKEVKRRNVRKKVQK
jgi:hypothetical protein